MPKQNDDDHITTVTGVVRMLAERGVHLGEGAIRRAADTGELPSIRTVPRGVRLFTLANARRFGDARARGRQS